jgi:hypothetical protein
VRPPPLQHDPVAQGCITFPRCIANPVKEEEGLAIQRGKVIHPLEQFFSLRPWGSRSGESQRLGSTEDEDSIAGCLEPIQDGVSIVAAHFSKNARSGAPPVRITQNERR